MNQRCAAILCLCWLSACGDLAKLGPQQTPPREEAAAPEGLTATPGDTFVDLSWTEQPLAEGYAVFRSQQSDSGFIQIGASRETQLRDPGVTPGTTFFYTVKPRRGIVLGAASPAVAVLTLPAPPSGLTAKGAPGSVVLNWEAVSGSTQYQIFRSAASGGPYVAIGSSTQTTFTDATIPAAQFSFYTVRAVNASGQGSPSAEASSSALTPAPANVTLVASETQVTVGWEQVPSATSYTIQRGTTPGGPYTSVGSVASPPFVDNGLAASATYVYVVRANGPHGAGLNSAEKSITLAPAAPTALAAATQDNQIRLTWTAPAGATGFDILRSLSNDGPYAVIGSAAAPAFSDDSVAANITYVYVVRARGPGGTGPNSAPVTQLSAPAIPEVSAAIAHTTATLTWAPSAGATTYRVLRGASAATLTQMAMPAFSPYQDTALTPFASYVYVVVAENANGDTSRSAPLTVTPGLIAPLNVRVVGGPQSIRISWDPVEGATGYSVLRSLTPGSGYTQIATSADAFYISQGLAPSTTYYFIVQAHDGVTGESVGSAEVSTSTFAGNQLCVLNTAAAGSVVVFDPAGNGNVAPVRSFGATAGLVSPRGFDVDLVHNEAVITSASGVAAIFAANATAASAPLRVLTGPSTELGTLHAAGFDPEHNALYVSSGNEVLVFNRTDTNTAPVRRWTETAENLFVSRLRNEVLTTQGPLVSLWNKAATGAATALRTHTQYGDDVFLDEINNELVIVNSASILFYRPQTLEFIREMIFAFTSPGGVVVDSLTDQIIVSDRGANQVLFFQRGFEGDVTPVRTIAGPLTQLNAPGRIRFCN